MFEAINATIVFALVLLFSIFTIIMIATHFYGKQQDRYLARHREIKAEIKRRKELATVQAAE